MHDGWISMRKIMHSAWSTSTNRSVTIYSFSAQKIRLWVCVSTQKLINKKQTASMPQIHSLGTYARYHWHSALNRTAYDSLAKYFGKFFDYICISKGNKFRCESWPSVKRKTTRNRKSAFISENGHEKPTKSEDSTMKLVSSNGSRNYWSERNVWQLWTKRLQFSLEFSVLMDNRIWTHAVLYAAVLLHQIIKIRC